MNTVYDKCNRFIHYTCKYGALIYGFIQERNVEYWHETNLIYV